MTYGFDSINNTFRALNAFEQARAGVDYRGIAEVAREAQVGFAASRAALEPISRLAASSWPANSLSSIAEENRRYMIEAVSPATEIARGNGLAGAISPEFETGLSGLTSFLTPKMGSLAGMMGAGGLWGASALATPEILSLRRGLGGLFDDYMGIASSVGNVAAAVFETVPPLFDWPLVEEPFESIVFDALEVWEEYGLGRYGAADAFMARRLKMRRSGNPRVTYDRRQALWLILRSAFERPSGEEGLPRWMEMEDEGEAAAYLRTAIFAEVRRMRRDREVPERVWWGEKDLPSNLSDDEKKEREKPSLEPELLRLTRGTAENPADVVVRWESYELDVRVRTLALLYHDGTQQDRDMVTLVFRGYEPVDLAQIYGWPKVQAFQRKAQRWKMKKIR